MASFFGHLILMLVASVTYLARESAPSGARQSEASLTKEFIFGTGFINSGISQRLAGRLTHHNLFSRGKILEAQLEARIPLTTPIHKTFGARIQYVDPNLFGIEKNFLITGVEHREVTHEYTRVNHVQSQHLRVDLSVGRRIRDYSFLTLGYEYRPTTRGWVSNNTSNLYNFYRNSITFRYGWNSEDDPYFPTRGSRFIFGLKWALEAPESELVVGSLGYQTTWKGAGGIWTFGIGNVPDSIYRATLTEEMPITLAYSQPFKASTFLGGVERGRWYIKPAIKQIYYTTPEGFVINPGLQAGIRLDSATLGTVDIYAIGSTTARFNDDL